MHNEKYAIWRLVMAESPKLPHSSAMDLWTRLWGRYHVPQNVFLVIIIFIIIIIIIIIIKVMCNAQDPPQEGRKCVVQQ